VRRFTVGPGVAGAFTKPRISSAKIRILVAVVLWGAMYPGGKLALREIPLLDFVYLRLVLAAAVLWLISGSRRDFVPPRPLWTAVVIVGLSQLLSQTLFHAGLMWTPAGVTAILLSTAPLMSAAWFALRGRERLTQRHWIGLCLGLLGVIFVIRPEGAAVGGYHVAGALISLCAAAAWVWYCLSVIPLVRASGAIRATAWSLSASALILTPVGLPGVLHLAWRSISWPAWGGFLYSSIVGMVVALTLWVRSVNELGANQTMIYLYVEPISAVALAALILGESLSIVQMAGAVMTFAGLWYAAR